MADGGDGPGEAIITRFILPRASCDPVITANNTMLNGVISNHQCAEYLSVLVKILHIILQINIILLH